MKQFSTEFLELASDVWKMTRNMSESAQRSSINKLLEGIYDYRVSVMDEALLLMSYIDIIMCVDFVYKIELHWDSEIDIIWIRVIFNTFDIAEAKLL